MDSSPELDPAGDQYRKWLFAKYVAVFFKQALDSGRLENYFELITKLHQDRWPDDNHNPAEVENYGIVLQNQI